MRRIWLALTLLYCSALLPQCDSETSPEKQPEKLSYEHLMQRAEALEGDQNAQKAAQRERAKSLEEDWQKAKNVARTALPKVERIAFVQQFLDKYSIDNPYFANANQLIDDIESGRAMPPVGMVRITSGSFMMGSPKSDPYSQPDERPQHRVTITRDFWLGKYEVTQAEWKELMGNNPSHAPSCGEDCPVTQVNWFEAVALANARSKNEGLETCYELSGCERVPGNDMECKAVTFKGLDCKGYRLPTEAEWEYAARAGTTEPLHAHLGTIAWFHMNSGLHLHPVGKKEPNAWGLYDMIGNVSEWVWDRKPKWLFDRKKDAQGRPIVERIENYPSEDVVDPLGAVEGKYRIYRGGSYFAEGKYCRAASRSEGLPGSIRMTIGFRLARTLP